MARKRLEKFSREKLLEILSNPDWHLVGGPGMPGVEKPIKILGVSIDVWRPNSLCIEYLRIELKEVPDTLTALVTLSVEFNCEITQPNPYTIELHKVFPHRVRRGEFDSGRGHTIDSLDLWLTFINVPIKAEVDKVAAARRAAEAAELAERTRRLAALALVKNGS